MALMVTLCKGHRVRNLNKVKTTIGNHVTTGWGIVLENKSTNSSILV